MFNKLNKYKVLPLLYIIMLMHKLGYSITALNRLSWNKSLALFKRIAYLDMIYQSYWMMYARLEIPHLFVRCHSCFKGSGTFNNIYYDWRQKHCLHILCRLTDPRWSGEHGWSVMIFSIRLSYDGRPLLVLSWQTTVTAASRGYPFIYVVCA